jgi:uncharacterized protein (TIGR02453 family)
MKIEKTTFAFLKALAKNNNRDWFQKNRLKYDASLENINGWINALISEMNKHNQLQTRNGKEALYRIYKDVRFSADKTPYNPRFAGHLKRMKPFLRGGYYFWIRPGATRIGCGFTYPNANDLLRIRQDIDANHEQWKKILRSKKLQMTFGELCGEQVKTAPKGFPKNHPAIELLRYKQFWFEKSYSDQELLSESFLKTVNSDFKAIRPFFNYMTEVLTTDSNGVSII